ncbi:MAG: transcription elongation factor GreA [Acidimicrobiales bacterium]
MSETHLSRPAHERLTAELKDLTTRGRVRIAQAIEAARALGDLSENGDYHAAKNEQGIMEARIRQLQAMLEGAVIVGTIDTASVSAGSIVSLRYEGDDAIERYLVGSIEERRDDIDVISPGSALGRQLLGRRPGDTVEYATPKGSMLRVEIVEVSA